MPRQMPQKMEELLSRIDNPDTIRDIQNKWSELVTANDNYELNYPQQFANLVEGNLKFKEQKTIPTPAEQMQMYESMVMSEISDHLEGKQQQGKEETYELDGKDNLKDKFRLNFKDVGTPQQQAAGLEKANHDLDKSQELNVTWLQDYKAQKEAANIPAKETQQPNEYSLQLNFKMMDSPDKSEITPEPEEPEIDKD